MYDVVQARRDVRRYRPDAVPADVLQRILQAAHNAPSVGHSQPWRFIVVTEAATRERAAWMADSARLTQAKSMDPESARQLLDLQLEGIREAPIGIVVCCDRRAPAAGVLGRATFDDSDMWSCACAIQNLWLAARAEGLGVGWVTLFERAELAQLMGLPDGVESLGWLCVGWPDERPPSPGLERAGWSRRRDVADVTITERWPDADVDRPVSRLRAPSARAVVGARDAADELLTPPGSLGELDRAVNKIVALGHGLMTTGTLVVAFGDHPVADLGVTAYDRKVGYDVLAAARAGSSVGVVAARSAGLQTETIDCGQSAGDLINTDALSLARVRDLIEQGETVGRRCGAMGLVALGEIGMGNTTVAAALTAMMLHLSPAEVVGLGAGSDTAMMATKIAVVERALHRVRSVGTPHGPLETLVNMGGPEFAFLTGVVLGATAAGQVVVLDGLATSICALLAAEIEPSVTAHLIAGQRSRERGHAAVLTKLGLEPLLDIRIRAGEGAGACLASGLLLSGLRIRREVARVARS